MQPKQPSQLDFLFLLHHFIFGCDKSTELTDTSWLLNGERGEQEKKRPMVIESNNIIVKQKKSTE
jgi:hypothetical protein